MRTSSPHSQPSHHCSSRLGKENLVAHFLQTSRPDLFISSMPTPVMSMLAPCAWFGIRAGAPTKICILPPFSLVAAHSAQEASSLGLTESCVLLEDDEEDVEEDLPDALPSFPSAGSGAGGSTRELSSLLLLSAVPATMAPFRHSLVVPRNRAAKGSHEDSAALSSGSLRASRVFQTSCLTRICDSRFAAAEV